MTKKSQPKGGTHAERLKREGGARGSEPPEKDYLTPDEMLDWLRREVIAVNKEAELRIRDATIIVTEYARGRISAEEADKRAAAYDLRWGDALRGVYAVEGKSDADILREMDADREKRMREHREGNYLGKPPSR